MESWSKGLDIEKIKKLKMDWLRSLTPVEFERYSNGEWPFIPPNHEPVIEDRNIIVFEQPKNKFTDKIFIGYK